MATQDQIDEVFSAIRTELGKAICKYPSMCTAHDGHSVLREEFEELWTEVKVKQGHRDEDKLYAEAIQTAAMAVRFAIDICLGGRAQK